MFLQVQGEIMPYADCRECGAKCCKFISISLFEFPDELDEDPERYFNLHDGIRVIKTRYGKEIVIHSRCKALRDDNTCSIYEGRPDLCKNFTDKTAHLYCVPKGCKYDPDDKWGEDYGVD
jgi:Fe-S-cluster containining protein